MPVIPLPENPSLEHLKKQAKFIHKQFKAGDGMAVDLVGEFHPRLGQDTIIRFKRADAYLVVARLYGFPSWPDMRNHVRTVSAHSRADTADDQPASAADRFAAMACVSYSDVDVVGRIQDAQRMLDADPTLGLSSIACAATTGNHGRVIALIDADPSMVNEPCGPSQWSPLLYCTYSRVVSDPPVCSTIETVRALLDRGADPNAGFLWRGLVPPFTALTGALGYGEQDQPPHPDAMALARLLLEAGADPNDGQALYNNGLAGTARDDPRHLELLVEFGLGTKQNGPWYERFGSKLTPPEELLYDELGVAASRGLPLRMRYLVGLELDLGRRVGRSNQTPLQLAAQNGHLDVITVLVEGGVNTTEA